MPHQSTKRFDGFSTCFRQHSANSHCNMLHGYALEFVATFSGPLNHQNWVVDFGALGSVKTKLKHMFDHTTLVADDDPLREVYEQLDRVGLVDLRRVESVGCESFARMVYDLINNEMPIGACHHGVVLESVTCIENKNNTATYQRGIEQ